MHRSFPIFYKTGQLSLSLSLSVFVFLLSSEVFILVTSRSRSPGFNFHSSLSRFNVRLIKIANERKNTLMLRYLSSQNNLTRMQSDKKIGTDADTDADADAYTEIKVHHNLKSSTQTSEAAAALSPFWERKRGLAWEQETSEEGGVGWGGRTEVKPKLDSAKNVGGSYRESPWCSTPTSIRCLRT